MFKPSSKFECVIFDMDGTLTVEHLDFQLIRDEMGVPDGSDILQWLEDIDPKSRNRAEAILHSHEISAARAARAADGAIDAVNVARESGMKTALLTRNTRSAMDIVLQKLDLNFDLCYSREDGPIKPAPDSILQACGVLGVDPTACVCVGDWIYDIEAANAAGCVSILLTRGRKLDFTHLADYTIDSMAQLPDLLGI